MGIFVAYPPLESRVGDTSPFRLGGQWMQNDVLFEMRGPGLTA
jgi:hypothetical protein